MSAIADPSVAGSGTLVGGLVGWNAGPVGASFATGNVTGVGPAGGLIGANVGAAVSTYATGSVRVSASASCSDASCLFAGGLIGRANSTVMDATATSNVIASYAAGRVSGPSGYDLGGLAGAAERDALMPANSAVFTNSYWDTQTSGQTLGVGSDDEDDNGLIDGSRKPPRRA